MTSSPIHITIKEAEQIARALVVGTIDEPLAARLERKIRIARAK